EAVILDGVATPEEFQTRLQALKDQVQIGKVQVRVVGEEQIAGRLCSIVEIRSVGGGAFYLRFWIDQQTGVRLKYENRDPSGRPVSETYFTSIDYNAVIDRRELTPASLPNVRHEPRLP